MNKKLRQTITNGRSRFSVYAIVLVTAILSISTTLMLDSFASKTANLTPVPSLAPMLEKITDAVVNISTSSQIKKGGYSRDYLNDPWLRRFFAPEPFYPDPKPSQSNLGSGVIVDADKGYVLTNNHVIADADNIQITLKDGRKLQAELIGTDVKTDIALLKIPAKNLTAIPLSDSDQLRVGDFVVAIGNPFGIGQTVTSGIISALGRTNLGIEGYEDFIQTDASINPGNSGGALVDLQGRLIGINTAILSKSGGNVGIGFAIPVNMAKSVMKQLIDHGQVSRGILGVHIQDVTPELAAALDIQTTSGAIIAKVMQGSAAEKAGLKNGDIIVKANNKVIKNAADLRNTIGLMRPNEQVRLELYRDNEKRTILARIGGDSRIDISVNGFDAGKLHPSLSGAILAKNPSLAGISVAAVKKYSNAWKTGIRVDDRIISINRYKINSLEDLQHFTNQSHLRLALNILRGNTGLYLLLE